jgi:hypothetical protein
MHNETTTEAQIAAVSTAPRVTPADIEANIASEHYFTAANGAQGAAAQKARADDRETYGWNQPPALELLTFCVLVLQNGFTVTGQSACASPENFNAEIGQRIAREDAIRQVWPLMGYQLREQLYQRTVPPVPPVEV